jgi:hypothetical protein
MGNTFGCAPKGVGANLHPGHLTDNNLLLQAFRRLEYREPDCPVEPGKRVAKIFVFDIQ